MKKEVPSKNTQKIKPDSLEDAAWKACLSRCGEVIRPGARDGKTPRMQVLARTYLLPTAVTRLKLPSITLERAAAEQVIRSFPDPNERLRLAAADIERALQDEEYLEDIVAFQTMRVRFIALVSNVSYSTAAARLKKVGYSHTEPLWGEVRGAWGLPDTLREFNAIAAERFPAWLEEHQAKQNEKIRRILQMDADTRNVMGNLDGWDEEYEEDDD
jgi:hypothetical protein